MIKCANCNIESNHLDIDLAFCPKCLKAYNLGQESILNEAELKTEMPKCPKAPCVPAGSMCLDCVNKLKHIIQIRDIQFQNINEALEHACNYWCSAKCELETYCIIKELTNAIELITPIKKMEENQIFKKGDLVTYIPNHANGINHPDCENGVVTSVNDEFVHVKYGSDLNSKSTKRENLVMRGNKEIVINDWDWNKKDFKNHSAELYFFVNKKRVILKLDCSDLYILRDDINSILKD